MTGRVFLTGATGSVGREVFSALRARGADVVIGARRPGAVADTLPDADAIVQLDLGDAQISPAVFEGADALFLLTPLMEDQVAASKRVLEAAGAAGVRHVVRLSSRATGWDQESLFRQWHRDIEGLVKASGCTWTMLRPCSFFQNFIRYQSQSIRQMSAIILPQGDGLISYIDAADIGEVAAESLLAPETHQGQTYVLTGARAYGPKGVAAEIGRVIGKPIAYIDLDPEQAREMMTKAGHPQWLVDSGLAVFAHAREGHEASVDPTLTQLLGRPATSLSEFVERNHEAWR